MRRFASRPLLPELCLWLTGQDLDADEVRAAVAKFGPQRQAASDEAQHAPAAVPENQPQRASARNLAAKVASRQPFECEQCGEKGSCSVNMFCPLAAQEHPENFPVT